MAMDHMPMPIVAVSDMAVVVSVDSDVAIAVIPAMAGYHVAMVPMHDYPRRIVVVTSVHDNLTRIVVVAPVHDYVPRPIASMNDNSPRGIVSTLCAATTRL